jgi:hypothetical protein
MGREKWVDFDASIAKGNIKGAPKCRLQGSISC